VNVTEIVDQVMARDDNISASAADNTNRRTRLTEYLREVEAEVWWRRDWTWKKKRDTVTVPDGVGFTTVPADFASIGNYGGVYLPTASGGDGPKLELEDESVIMSLREGSYSTGTPGVYALFGQDATTFLQLIQIPTNSGAVTLIMWYQPNPPDIDETTNVNAIKAIPEKYHQLVLVPGLRMKAREAKGDSRWQYSLGEYQNGLKFMQEEENRFQGQTRQSPSFFGRR